jgi:predicted transcriptional regulator
MENNKFALDRLSFAGISLPTFKENKTKGYTTFGEDNLYPQKLIDLYNKSPKHNAIVNQKSSYIAGESFEIYADDTLNKAKAFDKLRNINAFEDYESFNTKISQDFELFDGYYIEVIWNKAKTEIAELYHLPFQNVRLGKDCAYYSEDWSNSREAVIEYPLFNPTTRENKQVYAFKMYRAGQGKYPLPSYIGALKYIEIDVEIGNYYLSNIKNGFFAQTVIQMFKGQPTPEEMRIAKRRFKKNYQGAEAEESGGLIIMYNEQNEKPAEITNLQPSDFDKQFQQLNDQVQEEIFVGHRVSTPVIFGIATPGTLGQRNEIIEGYELFQTSYIEPRQKIKDSSFNVVFQYMADAKLKTTNKPPIGQDYILLFEKGILEKNEVRKELGFVVIEEVAMSKKQSDEDVLNLFAECGISKDDCEIVKFEFASASETAILQILNANDGITVGEIAKYVNIDAQKVMDAITQMIDDGLINSDNGKLKTSTKGTRELSKSVDTQIELRYEYGLDAAFTGEPELIDTSRDFCRQLIGLNRYYTRTEIDTISSRVDRDVWKERGGWYTIPDTDVHINHCRHAWNSKLVRKKL